MLLHVVDKYTLESGFVSGHIVNLKNFDIFYKLLFLLFRLTFILEF